MSGSISLSLACYDLDQASLDESPAEDKDKVKLELLSRTSTWPTHSRTVAIIGETQACRVPLGPPLVVRTMRHQTEYSLTRRQATAEAFVDISKWVLHAQTTIMIKHGGDMQGRVYALFAHAPTASQLRALEERRAKNRAWYELLDEMRKPYSMEEVFGQA